MSRFMSAFAVTAAGLLSIALSLPGRPAHAQTVFQAAGPTAESIQSTIDAFRAALGDPNGNTAGPLSGGRRDRKSVV